MIQTLDPFYPVVDSTAWIQRLVPLGVKLVQLRIKDQSAETIAREIAASKTVCEHHRCQLIVNDYWQAAIDGGCDYVHLGQEDLEGADVASIRKAGLRLGLSTHDHAELDRALSHNPDYVALGPIYPTKLKKMAWDPQGLDRIGEWKKLIGEKPLVAIGGITLERVPGVLAAGADIAAVVTDITRNSDPEHRTRDWIAATH